MNRPDWWLLLEYVAFFAGAISFGTLVLPLGCHRPWLAQPTFAERVDADPVAFLVLLESVGFIAYSTVKLNLFVLLRRKP